MGAFVASNLPFSGRCESLTSLFLIFFARFNAVSTADYRMARIKTDRTAQIRSIGGPVAIRNDVHEKVVPTRHGLEF